MNYIRSYFISFIVLISSIGTVNWFIDPFGMYWSPVIAGVNEIKPEAGTRSRISKAYQVDKVAPQILIVGNSRVEMGLDPNSKIFAGKRVYNQGMPGAHLIMQVDYAIDAIENNHSIEHVIMGVDFLDFLVNSQQLNSEHQQQNETIRARYQFRLSTLDASANKYSYQGLKEKLAMIFSLDALTASIQTLSKQNATTSSISALGFNSADSYKTIMQTEGIKPLFSQKLNEISARLNSDLVIKTQKDLPYSPKFSHLGRLISTASQHNIKLTLFINPYHYSYLHTLADKGQWQNFMLWKQLVQQYIASQSSSIALWDFSGFNEVINEAVPLDKPKSYMQWFWEPAHYKRELGERMLATLLLDKNDIKFGQRLTETSLAEATNQEARALNNTSNQWQKLKNQLGLAQ